jgi:transcriptional regulator
MMYTPPDFKITDEAWVVALVDRFPFGQLVTSEAPYPQISHLPLLAELRGDALWVLGHVARANPHAQSIVKRSPATLVLQGAHAYVSASWYQEPYKTVPTWNYSAAHLCGTLQECDAWGMVERLSERFEGGRANAWDPQLLEPAFRENQLRGIIAFELRADAIYAKAKLSQNRTEADRMLVIGELSRSSSALERMCAEDMRRVLKS